MTTASRSLWAGRGLALLGIILVALNVRTAVVAVSPIAAQIGLDIPLGSLELGVLGMIPPIAFALSGILAPFIAHRIGLEAALVIACGAMIAGTLLRAVADGVALLFVGSVLALIGMGFGNILLPPAVKKYFADRVGVVTAMYVTLVSVSAAVPPMLALPLADAAGWRVSVGSWAVVALLALVPWAMLWLRGMGTARRTRAASAVDHAVEEAEPALVGRMWRSPTAWAIALVCGSSSVTFYSVVAWLPQLLSVQGTDQASAAAILTVFTFMGVPMGLLVPWLVVRFQNAGRLVVFGGLLVIVGYLGLVIAPSVAWLWAATLGAGTLLFPLSLTLINLRTRSHQASTALSGFVQAIGYTFAAIGPLTVGLVYEWTADWRTPFLALAGSGIVVLAAAAVLARGRFVEEEWHRAPVGSGAPRP